MRYLGSSKNLPSLQCWIEATWLLIGTCLLIGSCNFHKYEPWVSFGSIDFYNEPWVLFGLCWVISEPCFGKIPISGQGSVYQSWVPKRLQNDWRHCWCTFDVFVGVRMTSLPVFRQTFAYSSLVFLVPLYHNQGNLSVMWIRSFQVFI